MNDSVLNGLNTLAICGACLFIVLTLCIVGMVLVRLAWDLGDDQDYVKAYDRLGYIWFANLIAEVLVLAAILIQLQ